MPKKKKTMQQEQEEALAALRALPRPEMDFTTPEGAILCLEDAYRRQDLEAACASKDFMIEAQLLLQESAPSSANDPSIQRQTAEVLQLAYRKEISENWPDMEGVESFFVEQQPYADGIVIVTEFLLLPDGGVSEANLRVAQTSDGWRVLNPV